MFLTIAKLRSLIREGIEEDFKYFHLSSKDLGETFTFTPRLPRFPYVDDNQDVIEDDFTPRVSWAKSVDDALKALHPNDSGIFYVYAVNSLPGHVDVEETSENGPSSPENDYGPDFVLSKYINWATENDVEVYKKGNTIIDVEDCVPDAEETHEQWATKPITAKQVAIIYSNGNKWKELSQEEMSKIGKPKDFERITKLK